jgi:N6-L-threonylcarbamoyladenine synthase
MYLTKCIRRHNRKIYKENISKGGRLKSNQAAYEVLGFRLWDLVKYNNQIYLLKSRRSSGYFELIKQQDGTKIPTAKGELTPP